MKYKTEKPILGGLRPVIDSVRPEIGCGRYAIKRLKGDSVRIEATVVLDGHDHLSCQLLVRHESPKQWSRIPMRPAQQGRDNWEARFDADKLGEYFYTVEASVDRFGTWRSELEKKFQARQEVALELREGEILLKNLLRKIPGNGHSVERARIRQTIELLGNPHSSASRKVRTAIRQDLLSTLSRYPELDRSVRYEKELRVVVETEAAGHSAWYEFFPRSASGDPTRHGTFRDAENMIPYIAHLGFDVVYLPPIHPIGFAFRKGRNNSLEPASEDPGSPWGIGASSGGHKSIHPELGTLADFKRFQQKVRKHGMKLALDIAFQCSPDHPYVKAHPEWFKRRPDGSIQYAENPPKKYQDIYPFHFESDEWSALWDELKSVVLFWAGQGVRIFRVDNPHTKPVRFWEWLIREVKRRYPDTVFLSEAFTRPSMMYLLAKVGFSQSYTYFTWRNTPAEFQKYMEELTRTEVSEYFRPNFWPNTPDILPLHLQKSGRPAFLARAALAATLSSVYGIYGPAYEQCVNAPFKEAAEEYGDSEKYEIKAWDLNHRGSISDFIRKLNVIRRKNPALHRNHSIRFHPIDNEQMLCFSKVTEDRKNIIVVVANLDFAKPQSGTLELPLDYFGLTPSEGYVVTDLLAGLSSDAKGSKRRIRLSPNFNPVAILRIEQ